MENENVVNDDTVDEAAGMAFNVARVTTELAAVTFSGTHSQIPAIIEHWVKAEYALSAINMKESNDGSSDALEAERNALERNFVEELKEFLVKPQAVKELKVEFPSESRGPAIRVSWDGCRSPSMGLGLTIPLP